MTDKSPIPAGLCQCGCGQRTRIAERSIKRLGHVRGMPVQFMQGHWARVGQFGAAHPQWKGGRHLHVAGYVMVQCSGHPRSNRSGYVLEHLLVAERALGYPVPRGVEVHHFNENRSDNRGCNLVICENSDYHHLLHVRIKALRACGDFNARQCWLCRAWGTGLRPLSPANSTFEHRECGNRYRLQQRHKREGSHHGI